MKFKEFLVTESTSLNEMKLVKTHTNGNKTAKVYHNSEWDEHVVKFHTDGKHQKNADYHTNDLADAHGTAKHAIGLKEDYVPLNELSKKTLGSYIKKASSSLADHSYDHGAATERRNDVARFTNRHMDYDDKDKINNMTKSSPQHIEGHRQKANKKYIGIKRATNKLMKESTDETTVTHHDESKQGYYDHYKVKTGNKTHTIHHEADMYHVDNDDGDKAGGSDYSQHLTLHNAVTKLRTHGHDVHNKMFDEKKFK